MDAQAYRIVLRYDRESGMFRALVPELPDISAEGETRAEAADLVVDAVQKRLDELEDQGIEPPMPLDEEMFSGELSLQISPELHRELAWQAKLEGTTVDQIVGELLAAGIQRRAVGMPDMSQRPSGGGERRKGHGRRPGMSKAQYMQIMEDKASFMEYVRNLEQGGGGRGGKGRRRK